MARTVSTGRKIEDAERAERADLETAESRVCKNMNIRVSTAEVFAGFRGLDNNRTLLECINARISRAFLESLLKSPTLATYHRGKSLKGSFLRSRREA